MTPVAYAHVMRPASSCSSRFWRADAIRRGCRRGLSSQLQRLLARHQQVALKAAVAGTTVQVERPVKFSIQQRVEFGESVRVVGGSEQFGAWNPDAAPLLEWGEGHVWTWDGKLPVGDYEFKVVITRTAGGPSWEEGDNRKLSVAAGEYTMDVNMSWGAINDMVITEAPVKGDLDNVPPNGVLPEANHMGAVLPDDALQGALLLPDNTYASPEAILPDHASVDPNQLGAVPPDEAHTEDLQHAVHPKAVMEAMVADAADYEPAESKSELLLGEREVEAAGANISGATQDTHEQAGVAPPTTAAVNEPVASAIDSASNPVNGASRTVHRKQGSMENTETIAEMLQVENTAGTPLVDISAEIAEADYRTAEVGTTEVPETSATAADAGTPQENSSSVLDAATAVLAAAKNTRKAGEVNGMAAGGTAKMSHTDLAVLADEVERMEPAGVVRSTAEESTPAEPAHKELALESFLSQGPDADGSQASTEAPSREDTSLSPEAVSLAMNSAMVAADSAIPDSADRAVHTAAARTMAADSATVHAAVADTGETGGVSQEETAAEDGVAVVEAQAEPAYVAGSVAEAYAVAAAAVGITLPAGNATTPVYAVSAVQASTPGDPVPEVSPSAESITATEAEAPVGHTTTAESISPTTLAEPTTPVEPTTHEQSITPAERTAIAESVPPTEPTTTVESIPHARPATPRESLTPTEPNSVETPSMAEPERVLSEVKLVPSVDPNYQVVDPDVTKFVADAIASIRAAESQAAKHHRVLVEAAGSTHTEQTTLEDASATNGASTNGSASYSSDSAGETDTTDSSVPDIIPAALVESALERELGDAVYGLGSASASQGRIPSGAGDAFVGASSVIDSYDESPSTSEDSSGPSGTVLLASAPAAASKMQPIAEPSNSKKEKSTESYGWDDAGSSGGMADLLLSAVAIAAVPVVGWSLFTLHSTGCGLPPGPNGLLGAAEGLSYLGVTSMAGYGLFKRASGTSSPGYAVAAELLSYSAITVGVAVLVSQIQTYGYIPSALPDSNCFGEGSAAASLDSFSLPSLDLKPLQDSLKQASPWFQGLTSQIVVITDRATQQLQALASTLPSQEAVSAQINQGVAQAQSLGSQLGSQVGSGLSKAQELGAQLGAQAGGTGSRLWSQVDSSFQAVPGQLQQLSSKLPSPFTIGSQLSSRLSQLSSKIPSLPSQ